MAEKVSQSCGKTEWIIHDDYLYFPGSEGDKESLGTLRLRYEFSCPKILSIISSYEMVDGYRVLKPFRIDLYLNEGNEDTVCCQGQAACCCCNTLGELLKPISEIDFVH